MSPLSGTTDCTLLSKISVPHLIKRWHKELGIAWTPSSDISDIYYWRDNTTGFCFYTPAGVAGDADLYKQLQKLSWYYMRDKWEFRSALQVLDRQKNIELPLRMLEVGVGKGFFLEQARDYGFEIAGVELNTDAAMVARDKGFVVYEKDLASMESDAISTWDVICSFQVLEHLSQPRLFLEQALALLKPFGLLIISVPNAAVNRKLDPSLSDLLDQPPHHMGHWDEAVFQSLEAFLPVKLLQIQFEPLAPYHIDWFIYAWTSRLRSRIGFIPAILILNPITYPLVRIGLQLGLRHIVRGHSLLAILQKTNAA